jgi:hypothetical protein
MARPSVLYCGAKSALQAPAHAAPTLPIIGSAPVEWNEFSIFIFHEISIARASKLAYSWS